MRLNPQEAGGNEICHNAPMQKPRISIIAAVGKNRELGKKNELIWRIRDDLQRVKGLTMGHPIVMGRNTHLSIGKPLPGRTNIVISHLDESFEGCTVVHSLEEALEAAKKVEKEEIFIFGGAYVYSTAIGIADRLYLTVIDGTDPDADAFFPDYAEFSKVIESEKRDQDGLAYEWVILERS